MTNLEKDGGGSMPIREATGFFRRQFSPPTTPAQKVFDVLFGIVAPILCFVFDPIVFRSANFGPALFPDYQAFSYLVSGIEILLLTVWLVWARNVQSPIPTAAGMLMAGAIFSALIGLVLLPFTLIGLVMGIGVLGFIPFLTSLVYLRNAKDAFRVAAVPRVKPKAWAQQRDRARLRGTWMGATIAGCVLAVGPPAALSFAASIFVSQAMNAVISADEQQADLAMDEIKYLQFFSPPQFDKIVFAYEHANEPSRKEQLRRRYLRLTGNDIEERPSTLAD